MTSSVVTKPNRVISPSINLKKVYTSQNLLIIIFIEINIDEKNTTLNFYHSYNSHYGKCPTKFATTATKARGNVWMERWNRYQSN